MMKLIKIFIYIVVGFYLYGCSGSVQTEENNIEKVSDTLSFHNSKMAMDYFLDGLAAESKGDYAGAVIELQEALYYDPQPSIYYQIAKNYFFLNKLSPALQNSKKAVELAPDNIEYLSLLQEIYTNARQQDSAIIVLEKIISIDSTQVNALYSLARLYETKRPAQAIEIYKKILNAIGNEWSVLIRVAELYERLGKISEATTTLEELLEIDPSNTPLQKLLAEFYIKNSEFSKALGIYDDIIMLYPDDLDAREKKAQLFIQKGEWENASKEFQYVLRQPEVPFEVKIRIGVAFFTESMKDSALIDITENLFQTIDKDTSDWQVKMYLGIISLQKGNSDSAIKYFDDVTKLAPWNSEAWVRLGGLLFDNKKYSETTEVLLKCIDKFPEDYTINILLGFSYSQLSNYNEAIKYLTKTVEIEPKDVNALSALGYAYSEIGKTEDAIKYINRAITLAPDNVDLLGTLGLIYDGIEDWERCDSVYNLALKLDSSNALVLNNFAYSYSKRSINLDVALNMITRALEKEPANSSYLDTMGWIYYKLENFGKAKEYIEKSLEIGGEKSVILDHLGDVLYKMGDKDKAKEIWEKALELDKSNSVLKEKIKKGEI